MRTSESILKISPAIVEAQGSIETVMKNGQNTFFVKKDGSVSTYATLDAIIEAARGPLKNNKLAVLQSPIEANGKYLVTTRLQHESGEFIEFETPCLLTQNTMQQFGSAITYAKRYALASLLNIATEEDDDGNATSGPEAKDKKPKEKKEVGIYSNPGEFVYFAGKFKGKKLSEMSLEEIDKNIDYWAEKKRVDSIPRDADQFLMYGTDYLINKGFYPPREIKGEIK